MKAVYDYMAVNRLDLSDPKFKMLHKLNVFVLVSVLVSIAVGLVLNYCLRMMGQAGGMYFVYALCGGALCYFYTYVHEFAHALAIVISCGKKPYIKFGKLAAYCGSPDIIFTKSRYLFVVTFPFIFYCALLIPLCIFIPAEFFPLPFMPLMYNIFGSVADAFMARVAIRSPKHAVLVDCGTDVVVYLPKETAVKA